MNLISNKNFCYWLQGYFEITRDPVLTKAKLQQIETTLGSIQEPLGDYTTWLQQVLQAIRANNFSQTIIDHFYPLICDELNLIFAHVIDNSYDTSYSKEYLKNIHDGGHV